MSVNIYSLRNPITNEIIYVGKTIYALNYRLNHHYAKLHECQKGKRNYTPLFKYLENLLPTKVTIELIEEVEDSEQNYKERYYAIKDNVIIKRFYYLYEINLFLNDKYSASNIIRALIDKTHCNCKGYSFKYEINN